MTQEELAGRLQLGQQAVSSWERGTSRPETNDLLLRLAATFPEHEFALWREVTGMHEVRPRPVRPKPVQPLLDTLPLEQLSFQQFQGFSALLLDLLYGDSATVNAFGVEGDKQDGIDAEVRFAGGRFETFQCKREKKFGPEKVRRAIRAHTVECDRAVILLSRRATAAARRVIRTAVKWQLWDTEDIARKIRALPLVKAKRIVDAYFPAYRSAFLGVADRSAFESPDEHFAPLLQRDHVFSHGWTLAGRSRELEALIALTERSPREITLLVGSGGMGKSRLVRALAEAYRQKHPDHAVFVLSAGRVPSATDFDDLADIPALLIVEDAHEYPQLRGLLATLARLPSPPRLLVTTRPYAAQAIRSEALHNGLRPDGEGTVTLQPLLVDQAEDVAREILADRKGPVAFARHIARLTYGSSLALVVGSYLVATSRIHPSVLSNSQQFRDELFGRFRDALTAQIGREAERQVIHETLSLIALLQPVDPDSPALAELAKRVLELPIDRVKRAVQLLHDGGVLVRRGRMTRIMPELLAEYVLESACVVGPDGRSTGYLERVLPHSDEEQLGNILLNVAKLDWRLTETDENKSRLADVAWKQIEAAYRDSLGARESIVEAVARAAYYQPQRALGFYDQLMEQGHRHRELPRLLRHVAMNLEHVHDAARRLWELGRGDRRQLSAYPDHPLRTLNDLASIEPGKSPEYCEPVARLAMRLIDSGQGGAGEHSAFGVLRAALATEGHTTEAQGHSLVISGFGVRRDAVASLRLTIIDFLLERLTTANLHIAAACAGSLADALHYPIGLAGHIPTEEDRRSWSVEFVDTLRKIRRVIERGVLDPFVTIRLHRSVNWHAYFAGPPTEDEARAVLDAIPQTLVYRVSVALADGWGHLRERPDDVGGAMTEWQEELRLIASEFVSAFGSATGALAFLRERLRSLHLSETDSSSVPIFIDTLLEAQPELADAMCESGLANPEDPLRDLLAQALYRLAIVQPPRALVLASAAVDGNDTAVVRSVAGAYGTVLRFRPLQEGERELVQRLVQSDDDLAVAAILRGIRAQATVDRQWTVARLLSAPIGRSPRIAEALLTTFTDRGELPFESLGEAVISTVLDKLIHCPSIDDHWTEEFLARASRAVPSKVIQFLIKRIERAESEENFRPMSYLWDERPRLRFRETADLPTHLKTIREWLLSAPRSVASTFWGPKLYRSVATTYDQVVIADLALWRQSADSKKLDVIARLLSEAPVGFVFDHQGFVVELLEQAASISEEALNRLRSALWASAISGLRHGTPGQPFPEDETRRDRSAKALKQISRNSPAWSLFDGLRRDAEQDIARGLQRDEELFAE